jgi:hypothetical protein
LFIRESSQHLKRVEFVSDRMSYTILRGHLCDIIFLNVHAQRDKMDMKESFYGELGRVFNKFLNVIYVHFNARVCREDIFKPTVRN